MAKIVIEIAGIDVPAEELWARIPGATDEWIAELRERFSVREAASEEHDGLVEGADGCERQHLRFGRGQLFAYAAHQCVLLKPRLVDGFDVFREFVAHWLTLAAGWVAVNKERV